MRGGLHAGGRQGEALQRGEGGLGAVTGGNVHHVHASRSQLPRPSRCHHPNMNLYI